MHSNRQCRPCDFSYLAENRFSDLRLRTPDVESEHEVLPLRCPTMKNHAYLASKVRNRTIYLALILFETCENTQYDRRVESRERFAPLSCRRSYAVWPHPRPRCGSRRNYRDTVASAELSALDQVFGWRLWHWFAELRRTPAASRYSHKQHVSHRPPVSLLSRMSFASATVTGAASSSGGQSKKDEGVVDAEYVDVDTNR